MLFPWCKVCTLHKCCGATGCTLDGAKAIAPDPNSEPKPEKREKTRTREENDIHENLDALMKGVRFLTPGSIPYKYSLNGHQ
jgi:hypothetical protein